MDQIAKLLRIGSDTKGPSRGRGDKETVRLMLDQWLHQGVPDDVLEALPARREGLAGRPVKGLLLGPATGLEVLEALKALYKERAALAKTRPEHDAATALYYATIGAALVLHGQRLSSYSLPQLAKAFGALAKKRWMDPDLRGVLSRAVQACADGRQ